MNKIIAGCIITLCLCACADKEPDHDSSLDTTSSKSPVAAGSDSQKVNTTDATKMPGIEPVSINPMPQQVVNQATTTTAAGMNPPHGQPGHRCDIAVGAPLNSPAAKPAATQTATPVTQTATPVTTAATKTAPGMNPPHGEPGHRCDIAVGAPLNSPVTKPATQTATPVTTPVSMPAVKPVSEPAKKDSGG